MLENARSQFLLCLLSILGAIACIIWLKPQWGPDLRGGTQLIYEVPKDVIEELIQKEAGRITEAQIMEQTITVIRERIDPNGTSDVLVTQSGETGILIELPYFDDPLELQRHKDRIANLGKLEMRMVADDDYLAPASGDRPEVRFNLKLEKQRVENWLKQPGNKELLRENPYNIRRFNDDVTQGPVAFGNLAWYVRRIGPDLKQKEHWDQPYSGPASQLADSAVKAYDDADYNNGVIPESWAKKEDKDRYLIELLAVNMHEDHFAGEDLDPTGVGPTTDKNGGMAVAYSIAGDKQTAYADWSEKYIGKSSAIVLNGVVKSAPRFISRIPGRGEIIGDFSRLEVEELVKVLRTGSLRIEPEFVSGTTIGPNLGQDAIDNGMFSLGAGGLLVFLFMIWYYRKPGVIACVTLLLNLLLLWAAMLFMQATLTLPGLGGIVLTLGMAVDANVIIYERIREELQKGKDMLRAVRAGFERAMSAILDSNITTFLVGLVLFNVGVGPVRGFAVTLMAGIVTTIFTQFFVTRLLFHFALAKKMLDGYVPRTILAGVNIDYARYIGRCIAMSLVVIVAGVSFAFLVVPREVMFGMDFTGGANLQMVVAQATTADDVRNRIGADAAFHKAYPFATVNTLGETDAQKRTNSFNIRIKLDDTQRDEITAGRKAWRDLKHAAEQKGEAPPANYEPPYLVELKRVFAELLVKPAFSATDTFTDPDTTNLLFAEIELHFQNDIKIADALQKVAEAKLVNGRITALPDAGADLSKDVLLQWKVPSSTKKWELFEIARTALAGLKTAAGGKTILSDPFPEAQEIQGRLVNDLRIAAISALILSWGLIIFYLRVRFHDYTYGIAAVVALIHDVFVTFGVVAFANYMGWVHAEISLNMIAAFLTIIGYSVNDTIIVFDRIRENLTDNAKAGITESTRSVVNRSLNQTLSRTLLTSGVTSFVVLAQFFVNWGSESDLESFAFAMLIGIVTGTYSSIYIAAPILIWFRQEKIELPPAPETETSDVMAPAEKPAQ